MSLIPSRRRLANELAQPLSSWIESFFDRPTLEHLPEVFRGAAVPPINVAENETTLTVSAELPGLEENDIDIRLVGNVLTIAGERKWENKDKNNKDKEFTRIESQFGSFSRTLTLPTNLRLDKAEAVYDKGVLTIEFPKVEPTPTAKIKVKKK